MVVGDKKTNKVLTTKKTTFGQTVEIAPRFEPLPDVKNYTVYALCDSYMGCDQAEEIQLE